VSEKCSALDAYARIAHEGVILHLGESGTQDDKGLLPVKAGHGGFT